MLPWPRSVAREAPFPGWPPPPSPPPPTLCPQSRTISLPHTPPHCSPPRPCSAASSSRSEGARGSLQGTNRIQPQQAVPGSQLWGHGGASCVLWTCVVFKHGLLSWQRRAEAALRLPWNPGLHRQSSASRVDSRVGTRLFGTAVLWLAVSLPRSAREWLGRRHRSAQRSLAA